MTENPYDPVTERELYDAYAAATGAGSVDGWEDPLPLGWQVKLPSFPVDALPGLAGRYALALSVETQTPLDLPGVVILGTFAACIGGRLRVLVRRGWIEPTNTFTVPVLAPGSRKSAVVSACEAPLDAAEHRLLEELAPRIREAMIEREIRDKYAEQLKQKASKEADRILIMEAQEAARAAAEVPVPAWPRLLADDATPEAIVKLLADQGGRIAAVSAEAGIFDSLAGRYTTKTNLEPMLKAHAGDSIRVDRRSREPERVDRPALTMIASIQPYALREMTSRAEFGGRGLLARVLWSLPVDLVGYRDENAPPAPEDLVDEYRSFVEDLAVEMYKRDGAALVRLSPAAYKRLLEYMRQVEVMLRPDGALGSSRLVKDWGSKLVGAVARISGALHIANGGLPAIDEPITEATMENAVRLGEYFRAHAVAALGTGDDKRAAEGRKVLDVVVGKDMTAFTMRELARRMPRGQQAADHLTKILDYLTELGWTRKAGKGWETHPRAAQLVKAADSADNADNDSVSAGQGAFNPIPTSVSTGADSADASPTSGRRVSTVSATADTRSTPTALHLTSENASSVSAVSSVSTGGASWPEEPPACPDCGWPYDAAAHYQNCEATR